MKYRTGGSRNRRRRRTKKTSQKSHVVASKKLAVVTKRDQPCTHRLNCRHGRMCWGVHTAEELSYFDQRTSFCAFCEVGSCKFGRKCRSRIVQGGGQAEDNTQNARSADSTSQGQSADQKPRNSRRPHRRKRSRGARKKRNQPASGPAAAAAPTIPKAPTATAPNPLAAAVELTMAAFRETATEVLAASRASVAEQVAEMKEELREEAEEKAKALQAQPSSYTYGRGEMWVVTLSDEHIIEGGLLYWQCKAEELARIREFERVRLEHTSSLACNPRSVGARVQDTVKDQTYVFGVPGQPMDSQPLTHQDSPDPSSPCMFNFGSNTSGDSVFSFGNQ